MVLPGQSWPLQAGERQAPPHLPACTRCLLSMCRDTSLVPARPAPVQPSFYPMCETHIHQCATTSCHGQAQCPPALPYVCLQCASIYGPCDQTAGCHPDGRCKACNAHPSSQYEDGLDPDYSYAMVNGTCLAPPLGCLVSHTLPGDRCSRCIAPGYVLLRNGTCMEVGPLVQPCLAARVFVCDSGCLA